MATKQLPALPEATTAEDNDLLLKRDDSSGSDQKLSIQTLRDEAFGDAAVEDASVSPTPDTLAKRDGVGRIQAASGGSGNETVVHNDTSTAANANTIAKRDGSGRLVSAAGGSGTDSVVHDDLPVDSTDLYGRTNILGTVSQSGGVPTGAVIERDSNANGEFVRFADGTQICTRDIEGVDLTGAISIRIDAYPINFVSGSIVSRFVGGQQFLTGDESRVSAASTIGFVDSDYSFAATRWRWGKSDQVNGLNDSVTITLTAIGRWF